MYNCINKTKIMSFAVIDCHCCYDKKTTKYYGAVKGKIFLYKLGRNEIIFW